MELIGPFSSYEEAFAACDGSSSSSVVGQTMRMGVRTDDDVREASDVPLFCYEFVTFEDCYKVYGERCESCDFEAMYGVIE